MTKACLGWKTRITFWTLYSAWFVAILKIPDDRPYEAVFVSIFAHLFLYYFLNPTGPPSRMALKGGPPSHLASREERQAFFEEQNRLREETNLWWNVAIGPTALHCLRLLGRVAFTNLSYSESKLYESVIFTAKYTFFHMCFVTVPLQVIEQVVSQLRGNIEQHRKAEAAPSNPATEPPTTRVEITKLEEQCDLLASRLSAAVAAASDSASKVQAAQGECRKYKEQCEQLTSQSKAMYEECRTCLREQLAKVETKTLAKVDEIQALWIGNAAWQGQRLHQVQQQTGHVACRTPSSQTSSEGSNFTQQMGYEVVEIDAGHGDDDDDANSSALSHSSWFSVKPHCFMVQALFKTRSYGIDFFLMGKDLKKGSEVVGADDTTILKVSEAPQLFRATEVVDLQAGDATLQVTPDHLVLVPGDGSGAEKYVPAGGLKMGDLIMLDSGEPAPLKSVTIQPKVCDVLKVVFEPDLPVAVFSCPPRILSKGQRIKPKVRRARMCYRGQASTDRTGDGGVSVPMTAGDYMD